MTAPESSFVLSYSDGVRLSDILRDVESFGSSTFRIWVSIFLAGAMLLMHKVRARGPQLQARVQIGRNSSNDKDPPSLSPLRIFDPFTEKNLAGVMM